MMRRPALAYRVVLLQASVLAVIVAVVGLLGASSLEALAGGVCVLLPNLWMARRAAGTARPGQELASAAGLFLAMFVKLGLTIGLIALALTRMHDVEGPAFFAGVIGTMLGHHASFLLGDDGTERREARLPDTQAERE